MREKRDAAASTDRIDQAEPMLATLAKEPMLAMEQDEPMLPMDSTEPREPTDSTESVDHSDQRDPFGGPSGDRLSG